jgi:hypothetical protein
MPAPPAFDYDLLRDLYLQHADDGWSTGQYQAALTEAIRATDPAAEMPLATTIRSVISRHRVEWDQAAHRDTHQRTARYIEIAPPEGALASAYKMDTPIRYLREVAADARGSVPTTQPGIRTRTTALNWAARMRAERQLVDLTPDGRPYTRPAKPHELNGLGELISLAAWLIPGWRQDARV